MKTNLFGPLGGKYCDFFFIFSLTGFIFFVLALLTGLMIGIKKKLGVSFYLNVFFISTIYLFTYFQNRLLYNMCKKTLR